MKKITIFLAGLILALSVSGPIQAKAQTGDLFNGQDHNYSVIFRGNGEAVVYGTITFTNTGTDPVKSFALQIPKAHVEEFSVIQRFSQYPIPQTLVPYMGGGYPEKMMMPYTNEQYKKLKYEAVGNQYNIALAEEIQPEKTGSILIAYIGSGYVGKSLGAFKYEFETPKVSSRIKNVNVAVSVDSELVLKGKKSQVNYSSQALSSGFAEATGARSDEKFSSPMLSNIIGTIGYQGQFQKSAQNLSPNESLTVVGQYAKTWWGLYWFSVLWKVLVGLAVIAGIIFTVRFFNRKHITDSTSEKTISTDDSARSVETNFHLLHHLYSIVGAGSAILSGVIIYYTFKIITYFTSSFYYYNSYDYSLINLGLMLVLGIIILALATVPPIVVGMRYGWKAGTSVVANYFLAAIVIVIIFIAVVIFGSGSMHPKPGPYMY